MGEKCDLSICLTLIGAIKGVTSAIVGCLSAACAAVVLRKLDESRHEDLAQEMLTKAGDAWSHLDDSPLKVELAFRAAVILAETNRHESVAFVARAEDLREQLGIEFGLPNFTYCLRLAVRAFSGLLPKRLDTEGDFVRLADQIGRVKSQSGRLRIWTDLALRCFRFERAQEGARIVREHVRPILQSLSKANPAEWQTAVGEAAPALYMAHHATAIETIKELLPTLRDAALHCVIRFMLRQTPPSDPFDAVELGSRHNLSHDGAVDICELLELVQSDSLLYTHVATLSRSAVWKHNRTRFPQNQRDDLAARLAKLVERKLPAPGYIKHEGYVILCEAEIGKLRKVPHAYWAALAQRGRLLPNLSDRVFVLAFLAEAYESGDRQYRLGLLNEARDAAGTIPCRLDEVGRLEAIAGRAHEFGQREFARAVLQQAMTAIGCADEEGRSTQQSIVDFAYRLDPDLATTLASMMDDDEARIQARKRAEPFELRKRLLDASEDLIGEAEDVRTLASAAWLALGSLNANRAETRHVSTTRAAIRIAATAPLREVYPVLAWVIENAIQRRAHADEARTLIRDLFEACLLGCDLAANASVRVGRRTGIPLVTSRSASLAKTVIRPGERQKALEELRLWLANEACEYLKISDAYFSPPDLELLTLVLSSAPKLKVYILTSKEHQLDQKVQAPWEDAYSQYWKQNFSDQKPPDTTIFVVGTQRTHQLPIHERWWLTRGGGLRVGTSFNSLGAGKTTEITRLTSEEASERELEVNAYLFGQIQERLGEKLSVSYFALE